MANKTHGVSGRSDPNFRPDPNESFEWDEKKQVYRKVEGKLKKNVKKLLA